MRDVITREIGYSGYFYRCWCADILGFCKNNAELIFDHNNFLSRAMKSE